nr:MAG TPA: hypothetical protein [Caudoviricetes sp.]
MVVISSASFRTQEILLFVGTKATLDNSHNPIFRGLHFASNF